MRCPDEQLTGVIALGPVVMAVGKGKVRAVAFGAVVLATGDNAGAVDVFPRRKGLTTTATIVVGVEAKILSGQGELHLAARGDAHAVRGRLGRTKGPAATAVTENQVREQIVFCWSTERAYQHGLGTMFGDQWNKTPWPPSYSIDFFI